MENPYPLYSKSAEKVMLSYLHDHFSQEEANTLREKLLRQYADFLPDLKKIGGKNNPQAQSVYDCIALFALYEVLPEKPSLQVFEQLVEKIFVPGYRRVHFFNMNWLWLQKLAHRIFTHLSGLSRKHRQDWPGNYHMETLPFDPKIGVRYRFTSCPIADFARTHGYQHLMPAMCNPDYPTLAPIHAGLIRTKVCATDDCCDYWIVGDKSPHMKAHPQYKDENGFIRNQ